MPAKKEAEETRSWARRMLRDPIAQILAEHSHLSNVQLETLVIDYLIDGFGGKRIDYETKASLRHNVKKAQSKAGVSRGAFNRSLAQARKNVVKSIFTLVLLGYLGVFETPSLLRYQNLANTIRSYTKDYDRAATKQEKSSTMELRTIRQAQNRILELIEELARPISLKSD